MTTVTLRLSEEEAQLIKNYAAQERRTVSDTIRLAILEKIEDEFDMESYKLAKQEFDKDPTTYTLAEIKEMHNLR